MKILMLTASPGNGHNSTAQKIKNKILSAHPDAEIKIVDMYKSYASKFRAWTMEKGYMLACNHIVGVYNYFFKKSERNSFETKDKCKANKEVLPMLNGLLKEIYSFKPDVIICTYIFCAVAVCNLRRCYEIPAKVICMTLDYGVSPYWECTTSLDEMFITDDYMINPFLERGFKKEQLIVSGIPVGDAFSCEDDKIQLRQKMGLDENMFTLLVVKSSFFVVKNRKLIKEFSKIKKPIQIIVCNGKDEKGKNQFDKLLKKSNLPHKIVSVGFVSEEDFNAYFGCSDVLLTKGGGLTLTETLTKGVPPIIIDKLPQQEIYNKKYVIDNNLGFSVDKNNSISDCVNFILENPNEFKKVVENIKKVRKLNVLDVFLNHIEGYGKADYSKILAFNETKKETIKKVNKARIDKIKEEKKNKLSKN